MGYSGRPVVDAQNNLCIHQSKLKPKAHGNHLTCSEFYQAEPWHQKNSPNSYLAEILGICLNQILESMTWFLSLTSSNKLSSASLSFHAARNPNVGHNVDFPSLLEVNHLLISPNFLVNGKANYSTSVNQSISMGSKNQGPLWASTHAEYIKWPLLKLMGQYHWIQGLVPAPAPEKLASDGLCGVLFWGQAIRCLCTLQGRRAGHVLWEWYH